MISNSKDSARMKPNIENHLPSSGIIEQKLNNSIIFNFNKLKIVKYFKFQIKY